VLIDGRLISGANDWSMIVWDVDTGKKEFEIEGHNECVNSIAVLSDGRVVSASSDQKVKVWE
jgi:WD40 repeat protein